MRPERHMLPKAAWPARCVPEPETRGIRATARPSRNVSDIGLLRWCSQSAPAVGAYQCPKTRPMSARQPSRSQHTAVSCSWPYPYVRSCEMSAITVLYQSCSGKRVLYDIGPDWGAEHIGERVSILRGLPICPDDGDRWSARHVGGELFLDMKLWQRSRLMW